MTTQQQLCGNSSEGSGSSKNRNSGCSLGQYGGSGAESDTEATFAIITKLLANDSAAGR